MNGSIALNRQIFDWEWWGDHNVTRLWITILMLANWKDKQWQGKTIKRGSFITSYPSLADATGLSIQQVRTAINKLKSTGEIQQIVTNKYQLIIVVNYEKYQDLSSDDNSQSTDNQQSNNSQITVNQHQLNKGNKGNKDNKGINNSSSLRGQDRLINRMTEEEVEIIFKTYKDADYLIDEVQAEVDKRKRQIKKPFQYVIGYAEKKGWAENGD